ncbi:MAG: oligosaccharide flippase family protein [Chthonomonadales bacterium]
MLTRLSPSEGGLKEKILSGSIVLLSGSSFVAAVNLAYNVIVAHFLGPNGFGNANALLTLLTLISAVTLSFQMIATKIVAKQSNNANRDAAYKDLQRAGWICGISVALGLILFQGQISQYLDLPNKSLVVMLALGAAFYVPLGCRRGYIQGAFGFRKLAKNMVLEGVARLLGSLLMVWLGFDVAGVVLANSLAIAVSYAAIAPKLLSHGANPLSFALAYREVSHAALFFAGQVLINNCDIVLVKHFFSPREAGIYAAIAMVGRVIFSCSSAIVNSMFPVVASTKAEDRKSFSLIGTALLLVLSMGVVMAVALRLIPSSVWASLFGSGFLIVGPYGFSQLLSLYAISTIVYCLSVVVMTYEMSYKIANTNWFQLIFSVVLIGGICKYHSSLRQVILVQLILLTAFLFVIGTLFVLENRRSATIATDAHRKLRLSRRITEDEVIAGFLQSEFDKPAYAKYGETLRPIVFSPDFDDEIQCRTRRALLTLNHGALWNELPHDTQWFEVEIQAADLDQLRVFPRAHWVLTARGRYQIKAVAKRIDRRTSGLNDSFFLKISRIREAIASEAFVTGPVILIGTDESGPLTILDGNHRLVAGVLEQKTENLKFVCGLSTNMTQCCWYKTNVFNLVRYGSNLLRALGTYPEIPVVCNSGDFPKKASRSVL